MNQRKEWPLVNTHLLVKMDELRRQAAGMNGPWRVSDGRIVDVEGRLVLPLEYIVAIHNIFIPVTNALIGTLRKQEDRNA